MCVLSQACAHRCVCAQVLSLQSCVLAVHTEVCSVRPRLSPRRSKRRRLLLTPSLGSPRECSARCPVYLAGWTEPMVASGAFRVATPGIGAAGSGVPKRAYAMICARIGKGAAGIRSGEVMEKGAGREIWIRGGYSAKKKTNCRVRTCHARRCSRMLAILFFAPLSLFGFGSHALRSGFSGMTLGRETRARTPFLTPRARHLRFVIRGAFAARRRARSCASAAPCSPSLADAPRQVRRDNSAPNVTIRPRIPRIHES